MTEPWLDQALLESHASVSEVSFFVGNPATLDHMDADVRKYLYTFA